MSLNAEELLDYCATLDRQRAPMEALWEDCENICLPFSQRSYRSHVADQAPDRSRLDGNADSTARLALNTLTLGCTARITPSNSAWVVLRPPAALKGNAAAVGWYYQCGQILLQHLAPERSNFYTFAALHYRHRGAIGTAGTDVLPADNRRGLVFRAHAPGSFSIAHDRNSIVNTIVTTHQWKPGEILKEFPEADIPESIKKLADDVQTRNQPVQLRQLVLPRDARDRDPRKIDKKNKAFASIWLYPKEKQIITESGFDEFPTAVSRWELPDSSPYGIPPAAYALPEAGQANYLEQLGDVLAEVSAFPRVLYGGQLKGDIDFAAMGLTCWDSSAGEAGRPQEWLTGGRYDIFKDRTRDKRNIIEEAFFVPLFNAISRLPKPDEATATAIRALTGESLELFHPIYSNTTGEFLIPLLRRAWSILLRQGAFPPPPPAVFQDDTLGPYVGEPAVEFTAAMARIFEQGHITRLNECLMTLGPLAATDPSVLDFINFDQIGPALFRAAGLPAEWINQPEAIEALRQARAQAQQLQMAEQAAGTVQKLGGGPGIQQLQQLAG